jgi:DNA ligase-1
MKNINHLAGFNGQGASRRHVLVSALYGLAGLTPGLLKAGESAVGQGLWVKRAALAELATPWASHWDPTPFALSEKLDGVRAIWDGGTLRYRSGRTIAAPRWFTQVLPAHRLDGELWLGRGSFDRLSATVRTEPAPDEAWRAVRYMVFDAPDPALPFRQRYEKLQHLVAQTQASWIIAAQQLEVAGPAELQTYYQRWVADGAEGAVLHRWDALWQPGRSDAVRKLKPVDDEEALLIGYVPGKGKYEGQTGALLLELPDGRRFALGTGLRDVERANPPVLGSQISYSYRGRTPQGLPRFASFLRVRAAE